MFRKGQLDQNAVHLVVEVQGRDDVQQFGLENGYLYVDELENCDEYLWTEGILSFRNDSFDEVVEKLRKYYDVEIEIRCATLPKVAYGRLKIRISEGIEHALRVLQLASDFTYEYDHDRNRIIIQ